MAEVVGWDLIYLVLSFTKGWGANPDVFFSSSVLQASDSIAGIFTFVPMVLISVLVLWATIWVITQTNLNSGIEKVSKVVIPLLFVIVVIIVAFSLCLPGMRATFLKDSHYLIMHCLWHLPTQVLKYSMHLEYFPFWDS